MPNPQRSPNQKNQRKQPSRNGGRNAEQRAPRNPSDLSEGQRQQLDPRRGSEESKDAGQRDKFSGEKMPKHWAPASPPSGT